MRFLLRALITLALLLIVLLGVVVHVFELPKYVRRGRSEGRRFAWSEFFSSVGWTK